MTRPPLLLLLLIGLVAPLATADVASGLADVYPSATATYWTTSQVSYSQQHVLPPNGGYIVVTTLVDAAGLGVEAALGFLQIDVTDPSGQPVQGSLVVRDDFGVVVWKPTHDLIAGTTYDLRLRIDNTALQDRTGRNFARSIDTRVVLTVDDALAPPALEVLATEIQQGAFPVSCGGGAPICWDGECGPELVVPVSRLIFTIDWKVLGAGSQAAVGQNTLSGLVGNPRVPLIDGQAHSDLIFRDSTAGPACAAISMLNVIDFTVSNYEVCADLTALEPPYRPPVDREALKAEQCPAPPESGCAAAGGTWPSATFALLFLLGLVVTRRNC